MAFVYISYAQADSQRIESILNYLRSKGHRLWDQEAAPGAAAPSGLREPDAIVALVSKAALGQAALHRREARHLLPGMPDEQLSREVKALSPAGKPGRLPGGAPNDAAVEQAVLEVAARRAEGWTLHEEYVAHAGSRLICVVIDADLDGGSLPSPLRDLHWIELPLPEAGAALEGAGGARRERAYDQLHAAVAGLAKRRAAGRADIDLSALGRLLSGRRARRADGGAPMAAAALAGAALLAVAVGVAVAGAQSPGWLRAQFEQMRQQVLAVDARLAALEPRARLTGQALDRQGALFYVLVADIRDPEICVAAPKVAALRLAEISDELALSAEPGARFAPGDGLYQVASKVYGANPHRVANLIFFANLDYFCSEARGRRPDPDRLGPDLASLRAPRLADVLTGLAAPQMAAPLQQGQAGGSLRSP